MNEEIQTEQTKPAVTKRTVKTLTTVAIVGVAVMTLCVIPKTKNIIGEYSAKHGIHVLKTSTSEYLYEAHKNEKEGHIMKALMLYEQAGKNGYKNYEQDKARLIKNNRIEISEIQSNKMAKQNP